ncbi:MAG: hypothetical protein JXX28_18630 [Deltaproteobacteria bacterium]|nr:hypothetical protein [Deltaproteobacteria bacterium]
MAAQYDNLRRALLDHESDRLEIALDDLDELLRGLPKSARKYREWWTNNPLSQSHSRHWVDAGFHARPDLASARVVFERRAATTSPSNTTASAPGAEGALSRLPSVGTKLGHGSYRAPRTAPQANHALPVASSGDASVLTVRFSWSSVGRVELDDAGRVCFPDLPTGPGVYRFTFHGFPLRIYVGESTNLRARMSGYRNPHSNGQATNQRLNALFLEALGTGLSVDIAFVVAVEVGGLPANLADSFTRRLVENAAILQVRATSHEVLNQS